MDANPPPCQTSRVQQADNIIDMTLPNHHAMRSLLATASVMFAAQAAVSQAVPGGAGYTIRHYKAVGTESLAMHVFVPNDSRPRRPAAVLLHGGGFVWGGPDATDGPARDYAAHGVVAFSVDYRLANRSTITPIEQIEDTFDAIRWVRRHAVEYQVDTTRLIAHGVSAGGYLAAMAAGSMDDGVRPQVLVLWSPGVGPGDDAYFQGLLLGRARGLDLSAQKHIRTPMPATVIISGALDSVTFDSNARRYCELVRQAKGHCVIHTYPELGHLLARRLDAPSQLQGRFDWDPKATADAEAKVWAFLRSLGYVSK